MYKYETHVHTAEVSKCGKTYGKDYIKIFKEMGYDGIFITDHFYHGNCLVERDLSWVEFVNEYCKGFEACKEEGDKQGLKVFFGIEESFIEDSIDYLVYGIDKDFLIKHPELRNADRKEFVKIMHEAGAIIVRAHPFRDANYIRQITLTPDEADATELINVHQKPICNVFAKQYIEKFGLKITCGSDIHSLKDIENGVCYIEYEEPLYSENDYVLRIKDNIVPKINYYTKRIDEPLRDDLKTFLIKDNIKQEINLNDFFSK